MSVNQLKSRTMMTKKFVPSLDDLDDLGNESSGEKEFRDLYSLDIRADKILEYNKLILGNRPEAFASVPKLNKELYIFNHEHYDLFWPVDEIFTPLDSILDTSDNSENVEIASKQFNCGRMVDRYSDWSVKLVLSKKEDGEQYIEAELHLDRIRWKNSLILESTLAEIYCTLQLRHLDERPCFVKSERRTTNLICLTDFAIRVCTVPVKLSQDNKTSSSSKLIVRFSCENSPKLEFGQGDDYIQVCVWPTFISLTEFSKYRPVAGKRSSQFRLIMDIFARAPKIIDDDDLTFPSKNTLEDWTRKYGEMLRSKPPNVQIVAGGKVFLTNHTLLEGRSPVLAKQLDKIRKETPKYASKLLLLRLDDIDANTMESVLEYMYTDKINVNWNFNKLKELYRVAMEYRICHCKQHIWDAIPGILTVENVLDVLEFAEKSDVPTEVSAQIIKFCEEHSDEIIRKGKGRANQN